MHGAGGDLKNCRIFAECFLGNFLHTLLITALATPRWSNGKSMSADFGTHHRRVHFVVILVVLSESKLRPEEQISREPQISPHERTDR